MTDFNLGDIVETIKGAKFWGEIVAFDTDEKSPGCTVRATDPGFEGCKHVYPLAQLQLRAHPVIDRVRPLDLANLLKHAYVSGFESAGGSTVDGMKKWVHYDPEACSAFYRIAMALQKNEGRTPIEKLEASAKAESGVVANGYAIAVFWVSQSGQFTYWRRLANGGRERIGRRDLAEEIERQAVLREEA